MAPSPKTRFHRLTTPIMEIFGLSSALALSVVFLSALLIAAAVYWFIHSAPPDTIIITSGAEGSFFQTNAARYQEILKRDGVTVIILPSKGSLENLQRLDDPTFHVDIGFIQGGVTNQPGSNTLVSLGSINYEPLLVFYRSDAPIALLSGFVGKRLAIGAAGSGTRSLALQLLAFNEIGTNGPTALLDLDGDEAANALLAGTVDVVFLMGDTTSGSVMRKLEQTHGIQLFDFTQADGYTRRIPYVNKLVMPAGSIDFGRNIPPQDINLIGPTVELIARPNLHPALSDLIIQAAQEVNSTPGLFKRRKEFPAAIEHDFPISDDATRYYKSGKTFFYKHLPFWLASDVSRFLVVFLPLVVVMIPAVKVVPAAFQWRMQMRINRWYRELLALERNVPGELTPGKREHLVTQIAHIEREVNKMKVPASFADQFYNLRGHIVFVRQLIAPAVPAK